MLLILYRQTPDGLRLMHGTLLDSAVGQFVVEQGGHYVPTVAEGIITLMLVGIGMAVFGLAVRYLPIMEKVEEPELVAAKAEKTPGLFAPVPLEG